MGSDLFAAEHSMAVWQLSFELTHNQCSIHQNCGRNSLHVTPINTIKKDITIYVTRQHLEAKKYIYKQNKEKKSN